jgi:hypothetical protein
LFWLSGVLPVEIDETPQRFAERDALSRAAGHFVTDFSQLYNDV